MDTEKQITILYCLLMILVSISLYTDLKNNKIKNIILYPFAVLGIILNLIKGGVAGGFDSLYGLLIPIFLLAVFYFLGAMGAGDLKLFGAIGALMGSDFIFKTIAVTFIIGGIIALFLMIIRKNARERLSYLKSYIILSIVRGSLYPYSHMKNEKNGKFPFAVAIFIGVLVMIFLDPLYSINLI